jgi:hypothetical protein
VGLRLRRCEKSEIAGIQRGSQQRNIGELCKIYSGRKLRSRNRGVVFARLTIFKLGYPMCGEWGKGIATRGGRHVRLGAMKPPFIPRKLDLPNKILERFKWIVDSVTTNLRAKMASGFHLIRPKSI